jgi:hypothetical protein
MCVACVLHVCCMCVARQVLTLWYSDALSRTCRCGAKLLAHPAYKFLEEGQCCCLGLVFTAVYRLCEIGYLL